MSRQDEHQTGSSAPEPRRLSPRGLAEGLATLLIVAGVFMLMQPFALWLFTKSFVVTLTGTVMFIITSHFPE